MDLNEKIQIETEFANAAYKDFTSKRFGLTPCCFADLQSISIKREACNYEELKNKELERTPDLVSKKVCDDPVVVEPSGPLFQNYNFLQAGGYEVGYPSIIIDFKDAFGDQRIITNGCTFSRGGTCPDYTIDFCAEIGSIKVSGVSVYAENEDCPVGAPCVKDVRLTKLGDCL